MKKLLACLTVLACSLLWCDIPARAQDCQLITEAKRDATCVVFYHHEVRGLWFEQNRAAKLRADAQLLVDKKIEVAKYAEIVSLHEKEAGTNRMIIDAQRLEIDKLDKALIVSEGRARECLEDQGSWLRSPVLWAVIGFLAGTTAVSIASAVN